MALTTVSSLSEMYSGGASSPTSDSVIKSTEKEPNMDTTGANPTPTKEGEDTAEISKEV